MNLKYKLIVMLLGVSLLPLASQLIYISSIDDSSTSRSYDIFEFDLFNCSYMLICDDESYKDFSIRPVTNEWVLIETVGILGWFNMNQCNRLNWGGAILPSYNKFLHFGQESDKNGYIWCFGEDGIVKINPPNNLYDYKGPIDNIQYGVSRATYLNGKYYSIGVLRNNPFQPIIIEFDTLDPMISKIICNIPISLEAFCIFSLHISCGDDRLLISNVNEFYEVNIRTGGLTFLCQINLPLRNQTAYEGSSPWPYDPRDCDVFLDLDINNSSGEKTNGFINIFSCKNNISLLSDIDPDVFSDYGLMDSIVITLLNPLDGNQEEITYQSTNTISVSKLNFNLTLIPSIGATNDSFEVVLNSLRYNNKACMITTGDRFIQFIAYKNGITDTAYCVLKVSGPFYNAGTDGQMQICRSDPSVSLYNLLGSCYTIGGTWLPALNQDGVFDPTSDLDSNYIYVVGDTICGFDTARIIINLFDPPKFNFPNDTSLCFGDSLSFSFNPNGLGFLWNDGTNSSSYIIRNSGLYWLELSNSNNCSYRDSINIIFKSINQIDKSVFICTNEMLDYKSKLYSPGDLIYDTLISQNSCDTILKIQVIGIPIPAPLLSADTIICKNAITTITPNKIYKSYLWSTNQTSQSIQAKSGSYVLTVTDQNDCTNTISINIHEAPEIQYELEPYDPLCSDDKGRIIMKATAGGVPPIRYFLNGMESKNGVFDNLSPGQYVSEIIDAEGCSKSDTIVILPASALNISIVDQIELEAGSSVLIKFIVLDGRVKLISFNPNQNITQEGTDGLRIIAKDDLQYEIQFEDSNGCIIIRTIQIIIKRNEGLYIPNIFSPNGDQINDIWEPYIGSEYALLQCSIFDRWGNIVYSSISKASWSGRFNDEPCLPGVYVYYLELKDAKNGNKKVSGEITLIR